MLIYGIKTEQLGRYKAQYVTKNGGIVKLILCDITGNYYIQSDPITPKVYETIIAIYHNGKETK
jgi:hypothetical protein